jgi:hypothetical protein
VAGDGSPALEARAARARPPVDQGQSPGRLEATGLFALLSVLFLGLAGMQAVLKPLGYDELFTVYLARLGPRALWEALRAGADLLPPLGYVLTGAAVRAFGEHPLVIRLPAILGFWLLGLGLFVFVARRTSPIFGALALLFALAAPAERYAFQARPYGIMVGFAALALAAWQAAGEPGERRLGLLGLVGGLLGATASHYYGTGVGLPLALGEAVRSIERRRIDVPVWAAIVVGLSPVLAFRPLMPAAYAYAPHFRALRRWSAIWGTYIVQFRPLLLTLVVGTAVLGALRQRWGRWGRAEAERPRPRWSAAERAAVLGFLLFPVGAVSLAMALGTGFATRYALPVVIGVSVVFADSVHALTGPRRSVAALVALGLVGWILGHGVVEGKHWRDAGRTARGSYDVLRASATAGDPIVVTEPMVFLPLAYAAPAELAPRLTYLADPDVAVRVVGTDTLDRALGQLARVAPIRVARYGAFVRAHPAFYVWEPPRHFGWVRDTLVKDGIPLDELVQHATGVLLRTAARE